MLPIIPPWLRVEFPMIGFDNLVREGLKSCSAVYSAILHYNLAFTEPPLKLYQANGKEILSHPILDILESPNDAMDQSGLIMYLIEYMLTGGQCYLYTLRKSGDSMDTTSQMVGLFPYHDGHIAPVPTPTKLVDHYLYNRQDGTKTFIPKDNITQVKWPMVDPESPWRAMAPLMGVFREVNTDVEATRYLYAYLHNDAMAGTIYTVPENSQMSGPDAEKVKADFEGGFSGDNRGGLAIFKGGTFTRVSPTLQEMDLSFLRKVPEARIASCFAIPPIVMQLTSGLDKATYANFATALQMWTRTVLVPLWKSVAKTLTRGFKINFPGDYYLAFDMQNVEALKEDPAKLKEGISLMYAGGFITGNEAREFVGLPPLTDLDVVKAQPAPIVVPGLPAPVVEPAKPEAEEESDVEQKFLVSARKRLLHAHN